MKHLQLRFARYKRAIVVTFLFLFSFSAEQAFSGGPIIAAGGSYASGMRSPKSFPVSAQEPNPNFKGILKYLEHESNQGLQLHCTAPQDILGMMDHALDPESTMKQLKEIEDQGIDLKNAKFLFLDLIFWNFLSVELSEEAQKEADRRFNAQLELFPGMPGPTRMQMAEQAVNMAEGRALFNNQFWEEASPNVYKTTDLLNTALKKALEFQAAFEREPNEDAAIQKCTARLKQQLINMFTLYDPEEIIILLPSVKVPAFQKGLELYSGFSRLQASTPTGFKKDTFSKLNVEVQQTIEEFEPEQRARITVIDIDKDDGSESDEDIQILGEQCPLSGEDGIFSEEEVEYGKTGTRNTDNQLHLSERGDRKILELALPGVEQTPLNEKTQEATAQ